MQMKIGYRNLHRNFPKFAMRKGTPTAFLAAVRFGSASFVTDKHLDRTEPLEATSTNRPLYNFESLNTRVNRNPRNEAAQSSLVNAERGPLKIIERSHEKRAPLVTSRRKRERRSN